MITRCPSCFTHFRVHPGQISARAGQVRCGRCLQVFDALEFLVQGDAPANISQTAIAPMMQASTPASTPELAASAGPEPPEDAEPPRAEPPPALEVVQASVHENVQIQAVAQSAAEDEAQSRRGADAPEAAGAVAQTSAAAAATEMRSPAYDFGPGTGQAKDARRWIWGSAALLLCALLLVQLAYHFRGALVILVPDLKPYALQICAPLGCDLPLPRRSELMSIEASDLQADTGNPNIMVLAATLKNRAIFDQQLPFLELTLTDAQDQAVVRRVLTPQDYVGKAEARRADFAANSEIAIKVFIESSRVKATGYRLYLFFP